MGIYCVNKKSIKSLKKNNFLNFDIFIKKNLNKNIYSHKHNGFWLDIGRVDDYEYADKNFSALNKKL